MELKNSKFIRILAVILLAAGLFYAYYNVFNAKFKGSESRKKTREITETMISGLENSDRMECNSMIYILPGGEQEPVEEPAMRIHFIHDLAHERLQVSREGAEEIFEYSDAEIWVYSKGISPVYMQEEGILKEIAKDRWYHYLCKELYGETWRSGISDRISYGYLTSEEYLEKIKHNQRKKAEGSIEENAAENADTEEASEGSTAENQSAEEVLEEEEPEHYTIQIKNTLRRKNSSEESDNEFRKLLSENGLHAMRLKKEYPEVYKMLKELYYQSSEKVQVWMDQDGKVVRIEKDYTFPYYMEIMKESSDKIEQTVGKYQYPRVICRQEYTYNPSCANISIPRAFEEL